MGTLASTWVCVCPHLVWGYLGRHSFHAAPLKSSGLSVEIAAACKAVSSPHVATWNNQKPHTSPSSFTYSTYLHKVTRHGPQKPQERAATACTPRASTKANGNGRRFSRHRTATRPTTGIAEGTAQAGKSPKTTAECASAQQIQHRPGWSSSCLSQDVYVRCPETSQNYDSSINKDGPQIQG